MATRCSWFDAFLLCRFAVALLLISICPGAARCSEEIVLEVAQPTWTDEGISVIHTTYAGYGGDWCSSVDYTCRANAVVTDKEDWVPLHDPRVWQEGRSVRVGIGLRFGG
jgi:hypothetical protein